VQEFAEVQDFGKYFLSLINVLKDRFLPGQDHSLYLNIKCFTLGSLIKNLERGINRTIVSSYLSISKCHIGRYKNRSIVTASEKLVQLSKPQ
jgi:hypothetical protein